MLCAFLLLLGDAAAAATHALSRISPFASAQSVLRPAAGVRYERLMARSPLSFEMNRGQFDPQVKFYTRGPRQGLFLAADGLHLALDNPDSEATQRIRTVVRIQFDDYSAQAEFVGTNRLATIANYFRAGAWITNVPSYAKVRQSGVYPGIDVVYYGTQGRLEYDFIVSPGVDASRIRLKLSGHDKAEISAKGELRLSTPAGVITLHKPAAYQESGAARKDVPVSFVLVGNELSFKVADYDRALALIIDPILSYSTYVTGSANDRAGAIAVDAAGNAYITGETSSTDFPRVGGVQNRKKGYTDAFVAKLDASGGGLIYSTFLGGKQGSTAGRGIAVDADGNAYVTGVTTSSTFPVTNGAYQSSIGVNSGFVVKLNAQGNALIYSTFVPGGQGAAIAIDAQGSAYISGTASDSFATTTSAFQRLPSGIQDAFVAKLNAAGSAMDYASFLGGTSGSTSAHGVAVDGMGNAYVTGRTSAVDFPVVNALYPALSGSWDAFVVKVNPAGAALDYATFLGGTLDDYGHAIAVDAQGSAHVAGTTYSANFPVYRAFQPTKGFDGSGHEGLNNAFIAKLSPAGDALIYSSYLGGEGCLGPKVFSCNLTGTDQDSALAVALDAAGNAYLAGSARSLTFPQLDPVQGPLEPYARSYPFVAKIQDLAGTGATLAYSVVLGRRDTGSFEMAASGVAVDSMGSAYAVGHVYNYPDGAFPITPGAFQSSAAQYSNVTRVVVFKLSPGRFTTRLASSKGNPTSADSITLTATIGSAAPGGMVTFANDGAPIGTVPVDRGRASITATFPAGVQVLTATYSYDGKPSPPLFLAVKQALICN